MPHPDEDDTESLLSRAATGDVTASSALLTRSRPRLKRMVSVRTDRRFSARFDDSDVVQDALAEAAIRLPDYLARRPGPFYPWLRGIAEKKLIDHCRRHRADRRSVLRQATQAGLPISDESAWELVGRVVSPGASPSESLARRDVQDQVKAALAELNKTEREVLVLYHLERLTIPEVAAVLGLPAETVKSRRRRAVVKLGARLEKLRQSFGGGKDES